MNGTSCHELDETDAEARAHMGHGLDEEYDIEDESVGFEDSYYGECALRPEEDASDSGGRPAEPGSFVSRQSVGRGDVLKNSVVHPFGHRLPLLT